MTLNKKVIARILLIIFLLTTMITLTGCQITGTLPLPEDSPLVTNDVNLNQFLNKAWKIVRIIIIILMVLAVYVIMLLNTGSNTIAMIWAGLVALLLIFMHIDPTFVTWFGELITPK